MPTSSVFADFSIKDKETAERFVYALEKSELESRSNPIRSSTSTVTDPAAIRSLLNKRKERK